MADLMQLSDQIWVDPDKVVAVRRRVSSGQFHSVFYADIYVQGIQKPFVVHLKEAKEFETTKELTKSHRRYRD